MICVCYSAGLDSYAAHALPIEMRIELPVRMKERVVMVALNSVPLNIFSDKSFIKFHSASWSFCFINLG